MSMNDSQISVVFAIKCLLVVYTKFLTQISKGGYEVVSHIAHFLRP